MRDAFAVVGPAPEFDLDNQRRLGEDVAATKPQAAAADAAARRSRLGTSRTPLVRRTRIGRSVVSLGKRNIDQGTVFTSSYRLEVIDALAGLDAGENGGFLVEAIRWNDDRDGAADSLVCHITEKTLSALVPGRDDSVKALANDRVVGGFDDRCEESCSIMSVLRSFYVGLQLSQTELGLALVLLVIGNRHFTPRQ